MIPGFTSWSPTQVAIDAGLVVFPDGIDLNVAGALSVDGNGGGIETTNSGLQVGGTFTMNGLYGISHLRAGPGDTLGVADVAARRGDLHFWGAETNDTTLSITNDCVVTNGGNLHLHSGVTNGTDDIFGLLFSVDGDLTVSSGSALVPHSDMENGASVRMAAGNVTVQNGGAIDADAKGWRGGQGTPSWGLGPGQGYSTGGGGYGGAGAIAGPGGPGGGIAGGTYGDSNAPAFPGSGGGGYGGTAGGVGGGLVWLAVQRTLEVDGDIRARGNLTISNPWYIDVGGGGAGGSVYIRCQTLRGAATGRIIADGGVARTSSAWSGGSGGGGRIAVWRSFDLYQGTASVEPGAAYDAARTGDVGTIVWGNQYDKGTLILVR